MIGMSAGAFQVASTATAYPEIYAAVGVSAGGGPGMAVTCIGHTQASVPLYARKAVDAMGRRARVMPFFTIGGTRDQLGEQPVVGGCARLNFLEWLYIDNTVKPSKSALGGVPGLSSQLPPRLAAAANTSQRKDSFETDPYSTSNGKVPNGYEWTSYVARDQAGCEIGERWVVHGMGHYWSGGSSDPKYSGDRPSGPGFNDPKGPSASQLSWNFFKQFSLKDGNVACRTH
jgi:poly(3-hydroxybutyrate) depolymerase